MNLPRTGREFYEFTVTTTPAVTSWEASFDGGDTWVEGEDVEIDPPVTGALRVRWLLAGPDAVEGDAVAVLESGLLPLVRAVDNPEVIVRKAPRISLT